MTVLWTADALAAAAGGSFTRPFGCSGVSIDTRTLRPGDLFVALEGDSDGHAHLGAALARGAAGLLVHRPETVPDGAPALVVADTLVALAALGRAGRARFGGRTVAVTGSVGKTTTKEMLRHALAPFGTVHAAVNSYNNHWGVPLTLARLPAGADFLVAEIGMNTAGETLPLARLVRPDVAVITTIAPAHIGRLGSLEAIAEEKATLLDALEPDGTAVLPADSPFLDRLRAHHGGRTLTFGRDENSDLRVEEVCPAENGAALRASFKGASVSCRIDAPGAHMAHDAAAALCCVAALGLDPVGGGDALASFVPMAGRGQQRRIRNGDVLLLDESYNANTASVRAALGVLADMKGSRRVAVLGDMLELGDFARTEHENLAEDVARAADLFFACGPESRALFDRVPAGIRGAHAPDSSALAPLAARALRPGDAVLVKGSLGSRMRVVVQAMEAEAAGEG